MATTGVQQCIKSIYVLLF